jgi:hypothetical protein
MTRKHDLEFKRQRGRARDLKHQRLEREPIVISDDEGDGDEDAEEGFVRVARYVKPELFRILNSFQISEGKGIYVSEKFRDPRYDALDGYLPQMLDQATGITALSQQLGVADTPLSARDREAFARFAATLESLARRTREAIADPVPEHLV